ncbi:MAG TPA: LysM domain-containing protein [Polyangiaceae bacterium]|nr:LysM domain-containing protein [Polyangiaceae bacterium]
MKPAAFGWALAGVLAAAHGVVMPLAAAQPGPSPDAPAPNSGASNPGAPSGNPGADTTTPGGTTTSTTTYVPFGVPSPGTDINAGLPSSSRPVRGDQSDTFDLGRAGGGSTVVTGNKGSAGVFDAAPVREVPDVHLVQKGDTLWDLCNQYYRSPWEWPKVWSYNPQIQNPHWIYPGDQLRLRHPNELSAMRGLAGNGANSRGRLLNPGQRVPPSTIFLRDQGYLGDPSRDVWAEIVGAVEEQMLLSEGNHVYLIARPGVNLTPGQELTVFRDVRKPEDVPGARSVPGRIVAVTGSVKVDQFDSKTRVARAVITESTDAIERGAKIGPVGRRFVVVPPQKNTRNVEARVLTSLYPHVYLGQNQIVFLDHGSADGLAPGNTLLILRRGDAWRRSLSTASKMVRDRVRMDSPARVDVETTPLAGNPENFPDEAVAELRVLRADKQTAVALVTQSRREVTPGDRAVAMIGR